MRVAKRICLGLLALFVAAMAIGTPAYAQQPKPNILFIMGDDIGWMQPRIYHRGLMVGETPNIDRIGQEGAIFMHYYAEESCTAGRTAFFTGMHPLRAGMIPPQLPGSPTYLLPGTPALAVFMRDLGYNTGEFGKNHLGDHTEALPTAHGFQEFWGYLRGGQDVEYLSREPVTLTLAAHRSASAAEAGSDAHWLRRLALVLLSQKVAAKGEANHLFGKIHGSAMGRLKWICQDRTMVTRGFWPMSRG
jgi:arylsulfatase A-like enzyme